MTGMIYRFGVRLREAGERARSAALIRLGLAIVAHAAGYPA